MKKILNLIWLGYLSTQPFYNEFYMIDYETIRDGKVRIYKYNGKDMSLNDLYELPECIISKSTLAGRLCSAIKKNKNTKWKTIKQCLTEKVKKGFNGNLPVFKKEDIKEVIRDKLENDEFVKTMNMMFTK